MDVYVENEDIFDLIDPDAGRSIQDDCIIKPDIDTGLARVLESGYQNIKYYSGFKRGITNIRNSELCTGAAAALDCFKMWYNEKSKVNVDPNMYWFHDFITKLDNHILKLVTKGRFANSYLASSIIIEHLGRYFDRNYDCADRIKELNEKLVKGEDCSGDDTFKDLMKISTTCSNKIKKKMEQSEEMGIGKSNDPANLEMISSILNSNILNKISIKKGSITRFVKHIIDRASESIGGRAIVKEESIFDSEDVEDIVNIENFLHEALLDDVSVREKKYYLNFDVYIDDSGSMTSKVNVDDSRVTLRALSRMFVFKLNQLNLLRDTYLFSHTDTLTKIDMSQIFTTEIDGGTDIQMCIKNAKKKNRPAIIVTDGWDHFDPKKDYYEKVYFVVLECNSLPDCFEEYAKKDQILFWINNRFVKPRKENIEGGYINADI